MFCPKCGSPVREDARFCEKCGAGLRAGANLSSDAINSSTAEEKSSIPTALKIGLPVGLSVVAVALIVVLIFVINGSSGGNRETVPVAEQPAGGSENTGGTGQNPSGGENAATSEAPTSTPEVTPEPTPEPTPTPAPEKEIQPKIIKLKTDRVYSKYDLTGDGVADTIKITSKTGKDAINIVIITINNKTVCKNEEVIGVPEIKLLQMSRDVTLISLFHIGEDAWGDRLIFSYHDSRWRELLSMSTDYSGGEYPYEDTFGEIKKITNDTVTVEYFSQNGFTGSTEYTMEYLYSDGELVPNPPAVKMIIGKLTSERYYKDDTLTARRKIPIYDNPNGEEIGKIYSGDDVVFKKIQHIDGRPWFYVDVYGTTGWIACERLGKTNSSGDGGPGYYFRDVAFSG
ncbi:MAG: zinc-ribbon domain-containing protein [Eubacterium sp.]|nr:zinc-ribbon domain-containing protein [Eubacterium sp.]